MYKIQFHNYISTCFVMELYLPCLNFYRSGFKSSGNYSTAEETWDWSKCVLCISIIVFWNFTIINCDLSCSTDIQCVLILYNIILHNLIQESLMWKVTGYIWAVFVNQSKKCWFLYIYAWLIWWLDCCTVSLWGYLHSSSHSWHNVIWNNPSTSCGLY